MEKESMVGQGSPRKSKYGRKKKVESQKQKHRVKLSFTDEELKILDAKIKAANATFRATYCHDVSLNYTHKLPKESQNMVEFKTDLKRIGVNLNQLVRVLNSDKNSLHISEVNQKVDEMLKEIIELRTIIRSEYK